MNVLVVEDNATDRKLAGLTLRVDGHSVSEAVSAEAAVEAIALQRPDVILLDLSLPGMDGLELARLLKANPATRAIPVVAVTAYPDDFPRAQVLAAGCDAYIAKPIDTRSLSGQLERAAVKKRR